MAELLDADRKREAKAATLSKFLECASPGAVQVGRQVRHFYYDIIFRHCYSISKLKDTIS